MVHSAELQPSPDILERDVYDHLWGPIQKQVIEVWLGWGEIQDGVITVLEDKVITDVNKKNDMVSEQWIQSGLSSLYRRMIDDSDVQKKVKSICESQEDSANRDIQLITYFIDEMRKRLDSLADERQRAA